MSYDMFNLNSRYVEFSKICKKKSKSQLRCWKFGYNFFFLQASSKFKNRSFGELGAKGLKIFPSYINDELNLGILAIIFFKIDT